MKNPLGFTQLLSDTEIACEWVQKSWKISSFQDVTCEWDEFSCESTGTCIPRNWICDGFLDCRNGKDEFNCGELSCPSGYSKCKTTGECFPSFQRCDGIPQCKDSSDEKPSNGEGKCKSTLNLTLD